RIERRRHRTLDYRVARRDAILGVVVTALDEVLIGTEVHGAVMLRADAGTGHGGEVWRLGQRDGDLHGGAFVAEAFDRGEEVGREVFWFEEFLKGPVRIDAAGDLGGLEFFATRQGDAGCRAVAHENLGDLGIAADVDAHVFGCGGERLRDAAHAAA